MHLARAISTLAHPCPMKDLLQKRKDLPPEEKKRSFIRYHRQWPYMDLAVGNNRFIRSDIRKEAIVQSVLCANPMFRVQEPEAWFLIASMKRSILFILLDHMWRKTFFKNNCLYPESHSSTSTIHNPKYTFAVSCNYAITYRHAVAICYFTCTSAYPYEWTD